ncbi:MAG: hypothetical protein RTU30_07245 [Candidatus Thorarchaeota archaeon]
MTYAFVVFYRFRMMSAEEADKARNFWKEYLSEHWPKELTILGDYKHAWGTEWSGFLLLESENPLTFFEFWPVFRDKTRWYVDNTRTVIGFKRKPAEWIN